MDINKMLKKHEGFSSKPYLDTTGNLTIGYGRNLHAVGISYDEAELMLTNDIKKVVKFLSKIETYRKLDSSRQSVLINMCFNMGIKKLLNFKKMWTAIEVGDFKRASLEMLDSLWAKQVKGRALELSKIMERGGFQPNEIS